jgi:hypothetical protein
METTGILTLEMFAEKVGRDRVDIMSRCAIGQSMAAGKLAAVVCQRAAGIVQYAEMARELAAGSDMSTLATLINKPGIEK